MNKITAGDIITYILFAVAIGLCTAGVFMSKDYAGMIVSAITGVAFLGILVAMIAIRIRFRATYNYWTKKPVKMGFRGKPCWNRSKSEVWIEAVLIFWERNAARELEGQQYGWKLDGTREQMEKALEGLTVFVRKDPWSYFNRLVVGVASHDFVAVRYEADLWSSAFAHELGHVIIGKIAGDWNEKTSHDKMKAAGFTNEIVRRIAEDLQKE